MKMKMKIILSMVLTFISAAANAQDLKLSSYDWTVTDIASKGLSKETLFDRMDRDFVKLKGSICSNRAMMWAHDFKRLHRLDTAKIFLFYTKKKSRASGKTWWYHVAPVVNEKSNLWVIDGGFPGFVKESLSIKDWTQTFVGDNSNCKEIKANDTELIERMFITQVFPQRTSYGRHDCYYIVTPHTLWTPETVAMSLLGKNHQGEPVHFERPRIDKDEYYQACIEATTNKIGFALGVNKKKCEDNANRLHWY
jgi:hypothetical protein